MGKSRLVLSMWSTIASYINLAMLIPIFRQLLFNTYTSNWLINLLVTIVYCIFIIADNEKARQKLIESELSRYKFVIGIYSLAFVICIIAFPVLLLKWYLIYLILIVIQGVVAITGCTLFLLEGI